MGIARTGILARAFERVKESDRNAFEDRNVLDEPRQRCALRIGHGIVRMTMGRIADRTDSFPFTFPNVQAKLIWG